jgi:hypothetical protein
MPPVDLSTYNNLVDYIEELLARGDLTDSIKSWIWLAEIELARELELQDFEAVSLAQTWTGGDASKAVPTDLLYPRHIEIQTDPRRIIYPVAPDRMTMLHNSPPQDGFPAGFMVHDGKLWLAPVPAANMTYDLYYQGGLTHLAVGSTNWLLANCADALLYSSLLHSAPFLEEGDTRLRLWGTLAEGSIESAKRLAWRQKSGFGPIQMKPDTWA